MFVGFCIGDISFHSTYVFIIIVTFNFKNIAVDLAIVEILI